MGAFKPMVKMETTEPSVILKLKKGGHVDKKASSKGDYGHSPMKKFDGGAMGALAGTPALVGRPAVNAPVSAPGKPSMASRRKAMMMAQAMKNRPIPAPMAPAGLPMKEGGKADMAQDKAMIKKAMKQHDMQEHKGGKGTKLTLKKGGSAKATGGVVNGQGGFKTGGVVLGNGGGYKTGGVIKGKPAGYQKGGAAKKFADGGSVQDDGRPVKMPQGHKKPPAPVSTVRFAGTYKKGGNVKKLAVGGDDLENGRKPDAQSSKEQKGYENWKKAERDENLATREFMSNIPKKIYEAVSELPSQAMGLVNKLRGEPNAVTKTKESVTVVPKKRGGMC